MAKAIENIGDIYDAVHIVRDIESAVCSGSADVGTVTEKMLTISDYILSSRTGSDEGKKNYSSECVRTIDTVKSKDHITPDDMENWYFRVREMLSFSYIVLALKQHEGIEAGNDDRMLLEYFGEGNDTLPVCAHYFCALRFDRTDPKLCYDCVSEDFRKEPSFLNDIVNSISYVYTPEKINETISESCPICGCGGKEPYYCAPQAMLNNITFAPAKLWMQCKGCHNLYAYNFPVMEVGKNNGHYTAGMKGRILNPRQPLHIYCDIFNKIKQFCRGKKYLEIGVGNGEMLAVALEMGYDVSAVEICEEDCRNISEALGVDIVWSDFLKYDTDEKFDVIIMGDVLEHVGRPTEALEKAYSMLNDGGMLWLSTPNFNSAFSRMKKFTDPMWNQLNHFTYFSYEGLLPFIEKTGFSVKLYDVSNRYNGSMELYLLKQ